MIYETGPPFRIGLGLCVYRSGQVRAGMGGLGEKNKGSCYATVLLKMSAEDRDLSTVRLRSPPLFTTPPFVRAWFGVIHMVLNIISTFREH